MSLKLPSSRFANIYNTLPEDAQRALLEKHLIPLLNLTQKDKSKKILATAARLKKSYVGMPVLDLKAKKEEVNALLDELEKDAKRSFVKGRSMREELLSETVDSVKDWLNDVWSVVFEYGVNFEEAHKCLLFVAGVLDHLSNSRGGCKCSFMNMYVSLKIKKKTGKMVKFFSLSGAHKLERPLLWIWRDLFLVILADGNPRLKQKIPEMLADIEGVMDWHALERLLYGGKEALSSDDEDDEEDEEEEDVDWLDDHSEDVDQSEVCTCAYHADHWPSRLNDQIVPLRELVEAKLTSTFKHSPSLQLWSSLLTISTDHDAAKAELLRHLSSIATTSTHTFVAALDIHAFQNNSEAIASLLDTHVHLLRPRDAPIYQTAATALSRNPFFQMRALQVLEKELMDSIRAIRAALYSCFSQLKVDANVIEMDRIMKLRHGSDARRDRIERWVDSVVTPGTQTPHPMAFAALMIGLPLGAAMADADDADPLGYLDLDQTDPDLEDLREEFRPKMKQRFETWVNTAGSMKGGNAILPKVYKELVGWMPFLKAGDAVDEMISRLADKPSKHHICDGLDALSHFAKIQRKKMILRTDKQRRNEGASAGSSNSSSTATTPRFTVPSNLPPPVVGGLNDVD